MDISDGSRKTPDETQRNILNRIKSVTKKLQGDSLVFEVERLSLMYLTVAVDLSSVQISRALRNTSMCCCCSRVEIPTPRSSAAHSSGIPCLQNRDVITIMITHAVQEVENIQFDENLLNMFEFIYTFMLNSLWCCTLNGEPINNKQIWSNSPAKVMKTSRQPVIQSNANITSTVTYVQIHQIVKRKNTIQGCCNKEHAYR